MQPNTRSQLQKVIEIIQNGQSGLICLPENATDDAVASATALYLGLTQIGRNVSLASSAPIKSDLVAADKIQGEVATSGDNLVISFPYQDGSIDKVDYFIQNDMFNIVVSPRAGTEKLNQKEVKFNYSGGSVDFIITVDTPNFRALGQLYSENQEQFKGKKIVNIDRHLTNSFYGSANYVNRTVSSTAELILGILQTMNVQIDKDIATNLYAGIAAATTNYTATTVNAGTFEASAYLLKQGAVKPGQQASQPQQVPSRQPQRNGAQQPPQPVRMQQRPIQQQQPQQFQDEQLDEPEVQQFQPQPQQPPMPTQPKSFERPKSARPNGVERDQIASMTEGNDQDNEDEESDEWLKPKIFKSQGPGSSENG